MPTTKLVVNVLSRGGLYYSPIGEALLAPEDVVEDGIGFARIESKHSNSGGHVVAMRGDHSARLVAFHKEGGLPLCYARDSCGVVPVDGCPRVGRSAGKKNGELHVSIWDAIKKWGGGQRRLRSFGDAALGKDFLQCVGSYGKRQADRGGNQEAVMEWHGQTLDHSARLEVALGIPSQLTGAQGVDGIPRKSRNADHDCDMRLLPSVREKPSTLDQEDQGTA